jgi:light-regulated signal transduction histidine kinase (bacteriophytochrome)
MTEKQHLDEQLQQLHRTLQQLESPDAKERQLLQQLQHDIQAVLTHADRHNPPPYTRLGERLQESIAQLETSHPHLTLLMGQIADMLARMGI